MYNFNKLFAVTMFALLAIVSCELEPIEETVVEITNIDSNPAEMATLVQLRTQQVGRADLVNNYKCSVGSSKKQRMACAAHDNNTYGWYQNVEAKIRCPKTGGGLTLSLAEVNFSSSSTDVKCFLSGGSVGVGFMEMTIQARNTMIFNYSAYFWA